MGDEARPRADWRLTSDQLRAEHLPQECEAYPWYPQGIEIPVRTGIPQGSDEGFYIVITEPWEAPPEHSDPDVWCTLGVYAYDGRNSGSCMIDLKRETELESAVVYLLTAIRHDDDWLSHAESQIEEWFREGKG